jgi:hypothetical protein
MRLLARPPATLLIEQVDGTVVLSENGDAIEVLVLATADSAAAAVEHAAPHVHAEWKAGRLLAEREDPRGGRASQRFELNPAGDTLTLTVRREGAGGRPPLELARIYHRYQGD